MLDPKLDSPNDPKSGASATLTPEDAASWRRGSALPRKPEIIYDQPWLTSLARPLLIVCLVGCLTIILVAVIERFALTLPIGLKTTLTVLGLLAGVVGCVTSSILAQPNKRLQRTMAYSLAELGVLLLVSRLLLWLTANSWPNSYELLVHPLNVIFDGWYWVAALLVFFTWSLAAETNEDLIKLALQPDELYAAQQHYDRLGEVTRASAIDRSHILRRFVGRWVIVGLLLMLLITALRRQLPEQTNVPGVIALLRQEIEPGVIMAVLGYFLLGLLLIGLGQLSVLRSRWTLEKLPMRGNILSNWPAYVLGLVLATAAMASLMPLGDTFLLAQILSAIINATTLAAWWISQFFMGLFLLLASLLVGEGKQAPMTTAPPTPPLAMPPPLAQTSPLPEWTGGAFVWLIMLFLLANALIIYFGGRSLRPVWLIWLWQALHLRVRHAWGALEQWRKTSLFDRIRPSSSAKQAITRSKSAALDLARLTPDELARYYYLSALEAAKEAGIPRLSAETPERYAERFQKTLEPREAPSDTPSNAPMSGAHPNIGPLTQAFVHVRYAGRHIQSEALAGLQQTWATLRDKMRDKIQ
jgi:hypothetical protein